jgi:hypothetical protein
MKGMLNDFRSYTLFIQSDKVYNVVDGFLVPIGRSE